tara:strand:+ start:114 stop:539 length:426 start_codon:yes stop_codon:yes gene_type:complete
MPIRGHEKTVNVKMPKSSHQVVQVIKAQYGTSMGDIMYYPCRHEIHQQAAFGCKYMQGVLKTHGIPLDPNATKECYGWMCKNCIHQQSCQIGRYEGVWEIDEKKFRMYGSRKSAEAMVALQKKNGQTPQKFLLDLLADENF